MKKVLIILMLFACITGTVLAGGLTYDQANYKKYRTNCLTAFGNDPLYNFINEVDGMLDGTGTSTITNLLFATGVTSDPTSTEGRLYYNSSTKKFKFYNASSWVTIEAGSSGNSLDGAYDVGSAVTVDLNTVGLTATNAADVIALTVTQQDTGATVAQTIVSAGTGALLSFDSNGTGGDMLGSDSTWSISKAGAIVGVGLTTTGELIVTAADVLFDDTYDLAWDTSRDTLLFQDSAVLGLGGAHDAAADTWLIHDGSNLSLLSLIADEGFLIGGTTAGFDITYAFETAGQIRTDYDGDFLNLTDDMDLRLGTGASADGDFMLSSNSSNLLTLDVVVAGTGEVAVGNDADDVPVKWYSETASDWVYFNADEVEFEDVVLQMMDATQIQFGDSDDFFMHATNNAFTFGSLTTNETGIYSFGADTDGDDVKMFGATTAEYWLWDASADSILPVCGNALYTMTTAGADQFKVNATGTVAGDAINFETTDGGIMLNADGAANGDIEINAGDDVIITANAAVTITNTEALTISGPTTLTGAATATAGIQSAAVTVTATADGLTTGLIPSGTRFVTVASDTATKVVVLPASVIGNIVTITVPATGCELQTLATTNETINTVDCDGTNELALVAGSVYQLTCTKAITWVATGASAVGANEDSLTPDAD